MGSEGTRPHGKRETGGALTPLLQNKAAVYTADDGEQGVNLGT
jgi:hypothetical protein